MQLMIRVQNKPETEEVEAIVRVGVDVIRYSAALRIAVPAAATIDEGLAGSPTCARPGGAFEILGLLAPKGVNGFGYDMDDVIYVPKTIEMLSPILSVVPLQLFAYYFAKAKGYNVDRPRNLAKSVTVE